jgi:copper homeostasis protein
MPHIVFELCAETPEACLAAEQGKAHRIELCDHLNVGGLTPSDELFLAARRLTNLPIHVMIRPHPRDFVYSPVDFASMANNILRLKSLGADGFVLGLLRPDRTVDITHTRQLVDLASPLPVTFHRAFDDTRSLSEALEAILTIGCTRILTSGGAPDVLSGAQTIAQVVAQAAGRIDIAVGGGLRLHNAARVASLTHATHFHGSVRRTPAPHVVPEDVRTLIAILQSALL